MNENERHMKWRIKALEDALDRIAHGTKPVRYALSLLPAPPSASLLSREEMTDIARDALAAPCPYCHKETEALWT